MIRAFKFLAIRSDLCRPLDISMGQDGLFYISEGGVNGLSPRVSLMNKQGHVVARWDSLSAHGSWGVWIGRYLHGV